VTSFVSSYGSSYFLSLLFGRVTTPPANYYIALCQDIPDNNDDGADLSEPSITANYARVAVPNDTAHWVSSGYDEVINAATIVWPIVGADTDWGRLTAFALCDVATVGSGNVLIFGLLTPAQAPQELSQLSVKPGGLLISLSSISANYEPT
jgi:hypothetical protein